jgi:hypothetical protein
LVISGTGQTQRLEMAYRVALGRPRGRVWLEAAAGAGAMWEWAYLQTGVAEKGAGPSRMEETDGCLARCKPSDAGKA